MNKLPPLPRSVQRALLTALLLPAAIVIAFLLFYIPANASSVKADTDFKVFSGRTGNQIAAELKARGLIRSRLLFKGMIYLHHPRFFSGLYRFPKGATTRAVFKTLSLARVQLLDFTLPEGAYLSQIADKLSEEGWGSPEDFNRACQTVLQACHERNRLPPFVRSLQGLLFPDTYKFDSGFSMTRIVGSMVDLFFEKAAPYLEGGFTPLFYRNLILASLVEKEYRVKEEAPLIASVFQNRLQCAMPLQSCATIVYILQEVQGKPHPDRLYYHDLQIDHPMNTYLHNGLPPEPICSPSMVALQAAFRPPTTSFLYFVVSDPEKGTHVFSDNLKSHNLAKSRYLESAFAPLN